MLTPLQEKNTYNLLRAKNLVGIGGTPSITAGVDIGSSPTVSFNGNDLSGIISIITGTGATAGAMASITFSVPKTGNTPKIFLQPLDVNAAQSQWYIFSVTLTGFDIYFNFNIGDSTTAEFNYFMVQ